MSNLRVIHRVKDSIIEFTLAALEGKETVDELEHKIFGPYTQDSILPSVSTGARRLYPTYLEREHPGAYSPEARAVMSGVMFGLFIANYLPIDREAIKYMLAKDLESIKNSEEFLERGIGCLGEIDFVPETIPQIHIVRKEYLESELAAGFGLVVANGIEAYRLEHS